MFPVEDGETPIHDEHTRLLDSAPSSNVPGTHDSSSISAQNDTLPLGQFAILCCLRTLDPLTFHQIFPYINQLIADLDIVDDESQIGFYS
jgi:hypothetical protein